MPEAAEVAVAVAQLDRLVSGRQLAGLTVSHPRTTRAQPADLLQQFVGRRVGGVRRHGKWIVVTFEGAEAELGIHLRMSGQLLISDPGEVPADRHVHAVLTLDREPAAVWFRDPRTFGEFRVLDAGAPVALDLFDDGVTGARLAMHAVRRRVGVKAVLLDQLGAVSGIGSYMADEALHRSGISPLAPAGELAVSAWEQTLMAARAVTLESAAVGGVTLPDEGWVDLHGVRGEYAAELRVHGRAACATCGAATRRATVGGRSARWCPRCQDARRRR